MKVTEGAQDLATKALENAPRAREAVMVATFAGLTISYKNGGTLLQRILAGFDIDLENLEFDDIAFLSGSGAANSIVLARNPEFVQSSKDFWGNLLDPLGPIKLQELIQKEAQNLGKEVAGKKTELNKTLKDGKGIGRSVEEQRADREEGQRIKEAILQAREDKGAPLTPEERATITGRIQDSLWNDINRLTKEQNLWQRLWNEYQIAQWLVAMGLAGATIYLLQETTVTELIETVPLIE